MTLQSNIATLSLYIKMGQDANPSEFSYDISFKNILPGQELTLTEKLFPKGSQFTIALKVDGFDVANNVPLSSNLVLKL